jgi:DNA-binding response OmpR family regulator
MNPKDSKSNPKTVLVIEDEVHLQRLMRFMLEAEGLKVVVKSSGDEGLDFLDNNPIPDLILLDILMPGKDGLTVLRQLKLKDQTKNIPVVLLTALAQENVVISGIKLGAKDYVRKPFEPKELVSRVVKLVA